MKIRIILQCLILITIPLIWSCDQLEENGSELPSEPFVYYSLISEKDSIRVGETTKIKANAKGGDQLIFYWSTTGGTILGSGAEVLYTVSPCEIGKNKVSCEINYAKLQSETKTIDIVAYE